MTGSDWSQTSLELSGFGSAGRLLGLPLICSGDCFRVATRGEILARDLQWGQLSSPPCVAARKTKDQRIKSPKPPHHFPERRTQSARLREGLSGAGENRFAELEAYPGSEEKRRHHAVPGTSPGELLHSHPPPERFRLP